MRNGKEVARSLTPFLNAHTQALRDMWGGFPPKLESNQQGLDMLTKTVPEFYFGHAEKWVNVRHLPNVLLLHYSNVLRDKKGSVQAIAQFLVLRAKVNSVHFLVLRACFLLVRAQFLALRPHSFRSV